MRNTGVNATMLKKELISNIASVLREWNIRKPITIPKQVFHISDDEGNSRNFTVKKQDKEVPFTTRDIESIIDACIYVIQEALKRGEEVSVHGFGKLGLRYRQEYTVRNVMDDGPVTINGHYVTKFSPGNDLKRCAQIYDQSLKDREINSPVSPFSDETDE